MAIRRKFFSRSNSSAWGINDVPAGPDQSVQFNDGGVFGGEAEFAWDKTTNTLTISGTITCPIAFTVTGGDTTTSNDLFSILGRDKTAGNVQGTSINALPGNGFGSGKGGDFLALGGNGGATGDGGDVTMEGGAGGASSGNGGIVRINGGIPTNGDGGSVSLSARAGVGTNKTGGSVSIVTGAGTGNASSGNLNFISGFAGPTGNAGSVSFFAANGGSTSGNGGNCTLQAGNATSGNGGSLTLRCGTTSGGGTGGSINLRNGTTTNAQLDASGNWILSKGLALGQSASAPALAAAGTITTSNIGVARVAPAAAVANIIMQAGTLNGQTCTVINQSAAANTITMDVAATSNVANGAGCVIAGLTAKSFVWNSVTLLWYPTN